MGIKINSAGYERAAQHIADGKVDRDSAWSFSAEDGNKMLDEGKGEMAFFAVWHLGHREGADEKTKDAWAYPFGKDGKVFRSALTAIRQRAGQQNDSEVFEAAGKLLEEMGAGEKKLCQLSDLVIEQDLSKVPDRILILPRGALRWRKRDQEGTLLVDDQAIASVKQAFADRSRKMVIDYEHQSRNTKLNGKPAPAAGWIKELVADAAGLWGVIERWTKEAAEYLAQGAYLYISPDLEYTESDGRVCVVDAVALTNLPATLNPNPLVLSIDGNPVNTDPNKEKEGKQMSEFQKKLALSLGLAETATEEEIMAAQAKALKKDPEKVTVEVAPKEVLIALGLKDGANMDQVKAAAKRLSAVGPEFVRKEDFEDFKKAVDEERWETLWLQLSDVEEVVTPDQKDDFYDAFKAGPDHIDRMVRQARRTRPFRLSERMAGRVVSSDAGTKLVKLAEALVAREKIPFQNAFRRVCGENLALAQSYQDEQRRLQPNYTTSAPSGA